MDTRFWRISSKMHKKILTKFNALSVSITSTLILTEIKKIEVYTQSNNTSQTLVTINAWGLTYSWASPFFEFLNALIARKRTHWRQPAISAPPNIHFISSHIPPLPFVSDGPYLCFYGTLFHSHSVAISANDKFLSLSSTVQCQFPALTSSLLLGHYWDIYWDIFRRQCLADLISSPQCPSCVSLPTPPYPSGCRWFR